MQIRRVRVQNFRSLRDVSVELHQHTSLIGANGSGKSSILRAIDLFFSSSPRITVDDFYGRMTDSPITITLEFGDFTEEERSAFSSNIADDRMTVARVFSGSGRDDGKYLKTVRSHSPFRQVREAEGARATLAAYNELKSSEPKYGDLPVLRSGNAVEEALAEWEVSHPEDCEWSLGGGFVGWKNVAQGMLTAETSVVFVPAVRDASQDVMDQRNSVISQLLQLVVQKEVAKSREVREFELATNARVQELLSPSVRPELGGLAESLTDSLSSFYADYGVSLEWREPEPFRLPLPGAEMGLQEGNDRYPVSRTGHGLQRALVLTLLQHLALAEAGSSEDVDAPAPDAEGDDASVTSAPTLSGLILLIEEPELYQHPIKQRVFARVLRQLAEGVIPGVAQSTQVIFATHSPSFVSLGRAEELRLVRRVRSEDGRASEAVSLNLDEVAIELQRVMERENDGPAWSAASLRPKLHTIRNDEGEAFFSDAVVVVEGVSDLAALIAVSRIKGISFDDLGIHVLAIGGKTKIGLITVILQHLGMPTFIVWDNDDRSTQDNARLNRAYQRLAGRAEEDLEDMPTGIFERGASLQGNLERVLSEEIGAESYRRYFERVCAELGYEPVGDHRKNPDIVATILELAYADGRAATTLEAIVDSIIRMRDAASAGGRPAGLNA